MQNILITGGTGLIGRHLRTVLEKCGYQVSILSRSKIERTNITCYWNPEAGEIDSRSLVNSDIIIHLAGASIAGGRWTKEYKQKIIDSRVLSTRLLYESLKRQSRVKTFISASAIGIYGNRGDQWVDEYCSLPAVFLANTCRQWEAEVQKITELGIRVVILRTGLVLADDGGILPVLTRPVKWGVGSILGNGNQFMSWIHINDLCRIYLKAVKDSSIYGTYNAVAPHPVTHREFMKTLANVCHRPLWLPPVHEGALKLFLGEKAELVLGGQRVSSKKITEAGFNFEFTKLEHALRSLTR